jgi:hypothetical protein
MHQSTNTNAEKSDAAIYLSFVNAQRNLIHLN